MTEENINIIDIYRYFVGVTSGGIKLENGEEYHSSKYYNARNLKYDKDIIKKGFLKATKAIYEEDKDKKKYELARVVFCNLANFRYEIKNTISQKAFGKEADKTESEKEQQDYILSEEFQTWGHFLKQTTGEFKELMAEFDEYMKK